MRTYWTSAVAAACLAAGTATSDESKADPEVAKLVRELGSPRFAVREAAEKRLVELGPRVKSAVLAGTKDADPEVARRCEVVLPRTQAAERQALLDETGDWPAPAGRRFRDMVGDSKQSRKLFVEMIGNDRRAGLADAAAADPARAARHYRAQVGHLVSDLESKLPHARDSGRLASPRAVPGDVALTLFLGSFPADDGMPDSDQVAIVFQSGFFELATGPQKEEVRKLFAAWLAHRSDPAAVSAGLEVALNIGLADAVPIARRWITHPKASAPLAGWAALVLGTHGSTDDLTLLSALRSDKRVYRGNAGTASEVQVRDVAAGMSLALRGHDVRAFGFYRVHVRPAWGKSEDLSPYMDVNWFGTPAERDAGHKRAWEWLDQQAGAPAKPIK